MTEEGAGMTGGARAWIPASAGMTEESAGMTEDGDGMTRKKVLG